MSAGKTGQVDGDDGFGSGRHLCCEIFGIEIQIVRPIDIDEYSVSAPT